MEEDKLARNLDGFYLRVERHGKWVNRCFTDLTLQEQQDWLKRLSMDGKRRLIDGLLECIGKMMEIPDIDDEELSLIALKTGRYVYAVGATLDIAAKQESD